MKRTFIANQRSVELVFLAGLVALACGGIEPVAPGAGGTPATSSDGDPDPGRAGGARSCAGNLALSTALRLAPAAAGQEFQRCATLGPERGWRVTLSPDGRRLAAQTAAGTVRLLAWDPPDAEAAGAWREVVQLAAPLGRIDALAFSPDSTRLATLSAEMGQVTLWRAEDGVEVRSFAGRPASIIDAWASALAFSSDGARLAASFGAPTSTERGEATGAVIQLPTGPIVDWRSGLPAGLALTVNPEGPALGVAVPELRFTGGDRLLFTESEYRVGSSPPSTRLSLHDPSTGHETVLFDAYTRALSGFAVSTDGRRIAIAATEEAAVAGFAPGLIVFRGDTGESAAADATFAGRVLGFSPDGMRLYAQAPDGGRVVALSADDLRPVAALAWPAEALFLGVSPQGDLITSRDGQTAWWNPSSGAVVRSASYALGQVTFSADGRYGAGAADGDEALFHHWRQVDGAELCAPRRTGKPAPPLASLGTTAADETGAIVSDDGSIGAVDLFVLHAHAVDWSATRVLERATGIERRIFGATAGGRRTLAVAPDGGRLFTTEGAGNLAVWCRASSAESANASPL